MYIYIYTHTYTKCVCVYICIYMPTGRGTQIQMILCGNNGWVRMERGDLWLHAQAMQSTASNEPFMPLEETSASRLIPETLQGVDPVQ